MLSGIIPFAHQLLKHHVQAGDNVADGTAGNGNDTLVLAQLVGNTGKVYAFDIQEVALNNTLCRLQQHQAETQVQLILASHEHLAQYVPHNLAAVTFNFGYLPHGDKNITTQAQSSLLALTAACQCLRPNGIITAAIYTGHEAGRVEAESIEIWAKQLPQQQYQVLRYQFINQHNYPPYLLVIYKKSL